MGGALIFFTPFFATFQKLCCHVQLNKIHIHTIYIIRLLLKFCKYIRISIVFLLTIIQILIFISFLLHFSLISTVTEDGNFVFVSKRCTWTPAHGLSPNDPHYFGTKCYRINECTLRFSKLISKSITISPITLNDNTWIINS